MLGKWELKGRCRGGTIRVGCPYLHSGTMCLGVHQAQDS